MRTAKDSSPDEEIDLRARPLVSDLAVAQALRYGLVALVTASTCGLLGWALYLRPDLADEVLGGIGGMMVAAMFFGFWGTLAYFATHE